MKMNVIRDLITLFDWLFSRIRCRIVHSLLVDVIVMIFFSSAAKSWEIMQNLNFFCTEFFIPEKIRLSDTLFSK